MEQAASQPTPDRPDPRVIEIVATARVIPESGVPSPPPPVAAPTAEAPPPPPGPPPAPPPVAPAPARAREPGRGWAIAAHLSCFADLATGVALVGIIGPLVIWLVRRGDDPFSAAHAKEALNFQINTLFWSLVFGAMICCLIGLPLLAALYVGKVVLASVAAIKAGQGASWRYPWTVRVVG